MGPNPGVIRVHSYWRPWEGISFLIVFQLLEGAGKQFSALGFLPSSSKLKVLYFSGHSSAMTAPLEIYLFIYLWLCWVFLAARGFSLVAWVKATLPFGVQASHYRGFSCCGTWTLGQTGFSGCGSWA